MERKVEGDACGTERRRSRSGVPDATGAPEVVEGDAVQQDVEGGDTPNVLDKPLRLTGMRKGRRLQKPRRQLKLTPEQRLMMLDTWKKSGLSAKDFGDLVGVSVHTLYKWKKLFQEHGPAGLMNPAKTPKGSKLPELTKRTILMIKEANPSYGCQRISDMLMRGPALPASPNAVARVLKEAGYEFEEVKTRPHRDKVRRFERAKPNHMWQTDLFTFVLKRQNRRIYFIGFLDDNSRYLVGYGLYGSSTAPLVIEVLRSAIASYGAPEEILTDNGPQYVTWRGKSKFSRELEKRGIKHIVATPKRPQTLGKIERFWGTLWRECVETSQFLDLKDARKRIGLFIDHYNYHRPHQGVDGLVPADRFFHAAPEVLKTLKERVSANALELARHGIPKKPFYVTGMAGGKAFSVHAEGERVFMNKEGEERQEVELVGPDGNQDPEQAAKLPDPVTPSGMPEVNEDFEEQPPGVSPLDEGLKKIAESMGGDDGGEQ